MYLQESFEKNSEKERVTFSLLILQCELWPTTPLCMEPSHSLRFSLVSLYYFWIK